MTAYFIRRFLLIIPTFLGITLAVFVVMQFVPGGPVERRIVGMAAMAAGGRTEAGAAPGSADAAATRCPRNESRRSTGFYGFDKPVHVRYAQWLWNVLHLNLGNWYIYQDPVWDVIKAHFRVDLLGLVGFALSYVVCIPLGVLKAVRHGSTFDFISSVIVFLGYAVQVALSTLLVLFGGGSFWNLFPLGGFRPDDWDYLSTWGKITGQLHHMALPLLYMVGALTTETILTKNSLMENLDRITCGRHSRRG
ncbi:MAG: hypothetical protein QM736_14205 [Vicinamibacterales bacterium]